MAFRLAHLDIMQDLLDSMLARVLRHADGIHFETALPRVGLGVFHRRTVPSITVYEPMICIVLQGAKQVLVGNQMLRYDTATCFAASVDVPATSCVIEAEEGKPYVSVSLSIDRDILKALLADIGPLAASETAQGFGVAPMTRELLEAWDRLIALYDSPADISFLAASREREVLYRLLQGGLGPMLRQMAREDNWLSQVRRSVDWIRSNYDQRLRTETLADIAGMSVPSFHRHFKAATAMSPLQYQKSIRLEAARRFLATNVDAARAAYAVGYESASQFSREYARQFGVPPGRDAMQLRDGVVDNIPVL